MNNVFCNINDLKNEADVEQLFVCRLLSKLNYPDNSIRPKECLSNLIVGGLRNIPQREYRPDFALKKRRRIRWIIEAKAPTENLDNHIWQPKGYCMLLNGEYEDCNPTKYYMLTNGIETRLYLWDRNAPILELKFQDFEQNNNKYKKLESILGWESIDVGTDQNIDNYDFVIVKEELSEVNSAFSWCHQHIYKKDNISQAEAFSEFVKLVALKLMSDRHLKDKYPELLAEKSVTVSSEDVKFSTKWIDKEKVNTPNPISDIQFSSFVSKMESEIARGERKRFFNSNERINLKAETIYGVVKKLEKLYLFGIDADLNGRLFETFLNATMRGKDLGQFFTPRSLVKLGVGLAHIQVHVKTAEGLFHTDTVIDACCGTGGFLIDVFAEMVKKVDIKTNLSKTEKDNLKEIIRKNNIVGIDIGKGPNLSRVARLNMYLHGDGGTRVFNIDALDKNPQISETDDSEIIKEKKEFTQILSEKDNYFDVVVTNPPFAKVYERKPENISETRILDQYEIGKDENGVLRTSVRSSLMFIERYYDLLKIGGRLITIIDDGILSGREYIWFRDYIRKRFLVRAVISMPGDAFQRSKARVKTSFLVLEKRSNEIEQEQPPVFMYACKYVGNDDPARQRTLPIDSTIRVLAKEEIKQVCKEYYEFTAGAGNPIYIVPPEKVTERLDVKYCLLKPGRSVEQWKKRGYNTCLVSEVLRPKVFNKDNTINTNECDDIVRQIIVRYNGDIDCGDEIVASDTTYSKLYIVNTGDLVISNIAASYGSVSVVPKELDGCVVSNEYTVLRAIHPYKANIIKHVLRSPEIRSEILLSSTGANRTRMQWENLKNIVIVYPSESIELEMENVIARTEQLEKELSTLRIKAAAIVEKQYGLDNNEAIDILTAFKPPK